MTDDQRKGIRVPGTNLVAVGFTEAEAKSWRVWSCDKHGASGWSASERLSSCPFCKEPKP
jgi:hypothetical protein